MTTEVNTTFADQTATATVTTASSDETFEFGRSLGAALAGGEIILLTGGLGAGKTLLTKGVLDALDYDVDEVTSPSFALVNLYRAKFDVYHIDLWRLDCDGEAAAAAVGLDDVLADRSNVIVIEWSEKIAGCEFDRPVITIEIRGDGDDPREIVISRREASPSAARPA
ncbi:MAG: tRNA (adenosine(37)-N6)-threonylcarbamoyltransferase complex ATPase subunit type 1 TsaE [Pyrinomonadaceae bacterium]